MQKIKLYLGITMILLSFLVPLLGFWVASLDLPVAVKGMVIGLLTVGGPEVLVLIAISLLGKEAFTAITSRVLPFLSRFAPQGSVSKGRYKVGLALFLVSFLPSYFLAYDPNLISSAAQPRIFVCMAADLTFVVSLFVLGGDFWDKLRSLFVYDAKAEFHNTTSITKS
jgi:hypothetical protein